MSEEQITTNPHPGHIQEGHGTGHGTGHGGEAAQPPFTQAEMDEFQKSDIAAGAVVILLMTGIFSVGLVLYTIVAFIVA